MKINVHNWNLKLLFRNKQNEFFLLVSFIVFNALQVVLEIEQLEHGEHKRNE